LKDGVSDPLTGVELVAAFFEADNTIFEMCDDSSGNIGMVFTYGAKELFVDYAKRCNDKEKIAEIILKVNQKDSYGTRDTLIDCAGECLPEPIVRSMIGTLQQNGDCASAMEWLNRISPDETYYTYERDRLLTHTINYHLEKVFDG
jgi:hypothetical protein